MQNIHATCVALQNKGILITGPSGVGKSDTALRLIEQIGAMLVADDRTIIISKNNSLYAYSPENLKGLLEVRGLGIISKNYCDEAEIKLVVELVSDRLKIERLPEKEYVELENIKIKKIKVYPFEGSSVYKIKLACDEKE